MAALLQHVFLLQSVGAKRPAAVCSLALCGCRHGKLVWQIWVCVSLKKKFIANLYRVHMNTSHSRQQEQA